MKHHPDVDRAPNGLHAVVCGSEVAPPGVIFVLRNVNDGVNIDGQNQLHPFYMVYMGEDGNVVLDHLSPKAMLDRMRLLCRGKTEPDAQLCRAFNRETRDGKRMDAYSQLLSEAIESIIHVKEERDIDSFLKGNQVSFLKGSISGLEDFELVCFLVVK